MLKPRLPKFGRAKQPGTAPGTLVHSGERRTEDVQITVIDYDGQGLAERTIEDINECAPYKDTGSVTWINIDGLHEVDMLETLGEQYDIHPLVLEDILSTRQRPKVEDYDDYVYIVLRMLTTDENDIKIEDEQFSMILGGDFLITFQEKPGDVFDPVRERLRNSKRQIRSLGADYLAYALIDAIVDHYFVALEGIGETIVDIEGELMEESEQEDLESIHGLKREMILFRKSVWPLREVIAQINRGESSLFQKKTLVYLRDVYDHTIQVMDTIESYRDMLSSLLDLYLSTLSNRMNDVMKVLTIIATIFIPLTFIAGIYGMNFNYMPELQWKWGYPTVWGFMIIIGAGMVFYFKKKKWF
ncbi:MAG: magnesium/cobalt transporter CorA [Candidatus Marinimicrobia bacterium]|nr:magnesium/cobalt transporter CorA [Candidatus Neomarinimicrobiota bacterium]MCF7828122.1 magnesium/cobalt transporter CorA [Candidatus Neomarinimicrobiota bacterium]MCF7879703.1 magnesium/cobalt transporter CorA [Candidatus Neomarinimicrobiota bacterium]